MKLKHVWITVLCCAVVAALAVGGTFAYLTSRDSAVNVMTIGKVAIDQIEQERDENGDLVDFEQDKPALPAVGQIDWADTGVMVNGTEYKVFDEDLKNVVDKIVTVKNTGKNNAFVRTIVAIEAPEGDPNDLIHVNANGAPDGAPLRVTIAGDDYLVLTFTYAEALAPNAVSAPSLMQVFLDSKTTNEDCAKFGDTWEILVLSQAVQADGFDNAAAALNEAFGEVNAANAAAWFTTVLSENQSGN